MGCDQSCQHAPWMAAERIWRNRWVSDKIVRLLRRDCRGADIDY
jgi:hypothetical protein